MADNIAVTAGSGTTVATDEIGGAHYQRVKLAHGADGSATDVSTTSPLPIGGAAADDAAASGNPVPVGGVYQATVDEINDGDVGYVRMTARRALITAVDENVVYLDKDTLSGSDLFNWSGGALVSGDFAIRDTDPHWLIIPLAISGYSNISVFMATGAVGWDQTVALEVWLLMSYGSSYGAKVISGNLQAAAYERFAFGSAGAVGQGGSAGDATFNGNKWYSAPALLGQRYVGIKLSAAVAPSAGEFYIYINRS